MQHRVAANLTRVDLDRELALRQQLEMLADDAHHAVQLLVRQKGRRTAAKMQLDHLFTATQFFRHQADFFFQVIQIGIGAAFVFGNDLVTAAVVANGVAERHMHVQRDRPMVGANRAVR